jgi:hypothetical protein
MSVTVDLAPLVNGVLFPLVSGGLVAVVGWAVKKAGDYFHFQVQAGQRQLLETAIGNGIAFAEKALASHESVSVDARVAVAAQYVLPKVPGALASLGITPQHLEQLITARLPS